MKKIICLFLFALIKISAQSVLTLDAGTILEIDNGSDLCVDSIRGNGALIGNGTICGNPTEVESENDFSIPTEYALAQNHPNPFNPSTIISWRSPVSGRQVLKVFDALGNEVATIVAEDKPAGSYEVEFDASQLASGIYFYRLQADSFVDTKKMILLR